MRDIENAAYLEVIKSNGDVFSNSRMNDIVFFGPKDQQFLISPFTESNASLLALSNDTCIINGSLHTSNVLISNSLNVEGRGAFRNANINDVLSAKDIHACNIHVNSIDIENAFRISDDFNAHNATFSNIYMMHGGRIETNAHISGQILSISSNIDTHGFHANQGMIDHLHSKEMTVDNQIRADNIHVREIHAQDNIHASSFMGFSRRRA